MKNYIGVDNGVSGAIAILTMGDDLPNGRQVQFINLPIIKGRRRNEINCAVLIELIKAVLPAGPSFALIETPAMQISGNGRKTNVSAIASTHVSFGKIKAVFEFMGIPRDEVAPQSWQCEFWKVNTGADTKKQSLSAAKALFPELVNTAYLKTDASSKEDAGRSDALLIAEYAKRKNF